MWLVVSIAGLFLLVVFLLAVPVDFRFRVEKAPRFHYHLVVGWLFGLLSSDVETGATKHPKRKSDKTNVDQVVGVFRHWLKARGLSQQKRPTAPAWTASYRQMVSGVVVYSSNFR